MSERWPASVPELGPMQGGHTLGTCIACAPGRHPQHSASFVRYGGHPLCRDHALALAGGADLPFVREALARVRRVLKGAEAFDSMRADGPGR